jgi:hypothetical protein
MRILRLGNSDDRSPGIADAQRGYAIAARLLESEIGEPVETIVKTISPTERLPELVERWLDEFQPDMVFLKVTWYWYGYESVPLRIERKLGRVGKPIADAGLGAAKRQWLARNGAFKFGRRMAHRVIGGDSPFEPQAVIDCMEACIRRVTAREGVVLVVKGTGGGRNDEAALAGYYERFAKKREFVEGSIEAYCEAMHVHYQGIRSVRPKGTSGLDGGDGLHKNLRGHEAVGANEAASMIAAWRAAHLPVKVAAVR